MFEVYAQDYRITIQEIPLGNQGEDMARCLVIDITDAVNEFGSGGSISVRNKRHDDEYPYLCTNVTTVTGTDPEGATHTYIKWTLTDVDTAVAGSGFVQADYIISGVTVKTWVYKYFILPSLGITGDVPDPYEDILEEIEAQVVAVQAAAASAEASATRAESEATRIISTVQEVTEDWLDEHIVTGYAVDDTLSIAGAAADAKAAGDSIRASYFTDFAYGAVASFPDGADGVPVKDLTVSVQAVQSGTGDPAPDNVRTIFGWANAKIYRGGNNLADGAVFSTSGYINDTGGISASLNYHYTTSFIEVDSSTEYFLAANKTASYYGASCALSVAFYDNTQTFIERPLLVNATTSKNVIGTLSGTFTTGATTKYVRFSCCKGSTIHQLCKASEATNCTIDLGGTRYGGTLDVTTGALTVTHGYYEFTAGTTYTPQQTSGGIWFIQTPTLSGIVSSSTGLVSNQYKTVVTNGSTVVDKCIRSLSDHVNVYDNSFTSAAAVETILTANPIQIVYPLTTPQTFALTPTQVTSLLGNNNIFADCGGSDVTYRADPRLYLEKLTNPDSDMTADANIASGQYFMVGNRLYLATSAIALGASIVPGTNCTATDLASALNAINA